MSGHVWHYAPWAYLPKIIASGMLLPGNAGAESELPMLWFSAHPFWEPTATKIWKSSGGEMREMTFAEQEQRVGCIRFGLPIADLRLLDWKRACADAGTSPRARRALEVSGRRMGANPKHWFACAAPIPLADLTFRVLLAGEWRDTSGPADMSDAWMNTHRQEAA